MKKLLLVAAVSAAIFAGQASAATAVPLLSNGNPDLSTATGILKAGNVVNEIYIAGSSAATPFIEQAIINDTLAGTTVYKITDSAASEFIYVGVVGANAFNAGGTLNGVSHAGEYYIVHKRDGGGSVVGIQSALGTLASFATDTSVASVLATTGVTATAAANATLTSVSLAKTTATSAFATTPTAANFNLADVDAAQFESPLNLGVAAASTLTSTSIATQTFGFAVTLHLRNALQKAAIAAGTLDATICTTPRVAGSAGTTGLADDLEDEVCMPSLTTEQLSSIWADNRLADWGQLKYGNTSSAQNIWSNADVADKPSARNIHLCSRTAGSGSLAITNVVFENAPCTGANEAIQASTTKNNITAESGINKAYHSMNAQGDVESCLVGLDAGTTSGTFTGANTPTSFRWAIGILNSEKNNTLSKAYRFIKIDGYSPAAHNVAEGKYKFWSELSTIGTVASDDLTVDLLANVQNATQISTLNLPNANFGITGYLGIANNAAYLPTTTTAINGLLNAGFDASRPVNPYTHDVANGGNGNHCRVATIPGGATRALPVLR